MTKRFNSQDLSKQAAARGLVHWQTSGRQSAYYGRITLALLGEGVTRRSCSLHHPQSEIIAMRVFYRNGYLFSVATTAAALEFIHKWARYVVPITVD